MHPIEMLRSVARSRGGAPADIGAEAAWCLAALAADEPAAVLPACRRLLERHPGCGPLWWVSARVLTAGDEILEAEQCASLLMEDPTSDTLSECIFDARDGDLADLPLRVARHGRVGELAAADAVLVEATALGPGSMVIASSSNSLLQASEAAGTPLWVEAGVGRVLPPKLWRALLDRIATKSAGNITHPGTAEMVVSLENVERVIGPGWICRGRDLGVEQADGCPEPPELTAGW
jgi:hypothetical protein